MKKKQRKMILQVVGFCLILMLTACRHTDAQVIGKDAQEKQEDKKSAIGRPAHPGRVLAPVKMNRGPGAVW